METNFIPLEEKNFSENLKENVSNAKNEIILNNNKKTKKINKITNKPQKRKRPNSPSMDLEEDIYNNKNNKNINKKKKVPLIKLVERINLNDPEPENKSPQPQSNFSDKKNFNFSKNNKKRGVKIFSDMSISEVSNNLFKNYYPCILPEYYQDQISEQIIQNQLDKLISNFITEKKEELKNKKIKINQNLDYLRQLAEKQGEWVDYENVDDRYQENEEEEKGYKSYDSNSENNSNNSYPEDESIEKDEYDQDEDYEQDFDDKYDYYENDGNGDDDY
jgi:hypothetical protein